MVINFNLVLVWIPMCKYTLTKLAVMACRLNSRQKNQLSRLVSSSSSSSSCSLSVDAKAYVGGQTSNACSSPIARPIALSNKKTDLDANAPYGFRSALGHVAKKLMILARRLNFRTKCWLCELKIDTINSFLVAVDHATSLHTISATTITLASVIHTVAHLMNVINFSNKFDPLLGNMNMAEYKGQNPLQLLVSVPGITGCFMILILFLMSLSSISAIRNSSFDLFQIFHRLSILFVVFLVLHPSSHVLKEQANVERHHPDLCYERMLSLREEILAASPEERNNGTYGNTPPMAGNERARSAESTANHSLVSSARSIAPARMQYLQYTPRAKAHEAQVYVNSTLTPTKIPPSDNQSCHDLVPLFVAQSSICWYVLGAGLSCYLLDLLLRRLRRSRNPIELLEARCDAEGNLIELILSNNHKRFAHWLPGQFVYLNCPQIATYEWHPFTISSMDNGSRQFTLHIKTGGDWTRKLRHELQLRQNSMSLLSHQLKQREQHQENIYSIQSCSRLGFGRARCLTLFRQGRLSNCPGRAYDYWPGQRWSWWWSSPSSSSSSSSPSQVQCKSLASLKHGQSNDRSNGTRSGDDYVKIDLDDVQIWAERRHQLDLFIDGPFHSPFERLLEQQVSVCIANGVGWTAFSSVFQQITNRQNFRPSTTEEVDVDGRDWWAQWRDFVSSKQGRRETTTERIDDPPPEVAAGRPTTSETKLHLMIIVTTIEQLKPFYTLAMNYFKRMNARGASGGGPVKEITVFLTRSTKDDAEVVEFCHRETLKMTSGTSDPLLVNDLLSIHFQRPDFGAYLDKFSHLYGNERKISVYCCGSYLVKRTVEEVCQNFNRSSLSTGGGREHCVRPIYQYHEENF